MRTRYRDAILGLLLFVVAGTVASAAENRMPADRAKAAVAACGGYTRAAAKFRGVALTAAKNAMAAQDKEACLVVSALDAGDLAALKKAEASLKKATAEAVRARETVAEIIGCVDRAVSAETRAREEVVRAAESKTPKEAEAAARQAERAAKEAEQATRDAGDLLEDLKRKWLVPNIGVAAEAPRSARE
jgi:hypothetical protein